MDPLLLHLSNVSPCTFMCSVTHYFYYGYTKKSKNGTKYVKLLN